MTTRSRKDAVRPGAKGRIKAMKQARDAQGQFIKKLPAPIDEAAIQEVATQRELAQSEGNRFRPTKDQWDQLVHEAWTLWHHGMPLSTVADTLRLPDSSVRRALAEGHKRFVDDPEHMRGWANANYAAIIESAINSGDFEEARKATTDYLRANNLLPTGVGNAVQVNVLSESEVSTHVKDFIARHDAPTHPATAQKASD